MTGEASPYSEMRKDVYKDSPYSVGAQYTPQGTDEMYSALYNKGGGYNLGYNKGPVNVSYTSNPGLGNNVMLRGQYNFADGGVASMFRERPEYSLGGPTKAIRKIGGPTQKEIDDFVNMPVAMGQFMGPDALPGEDYGTYVRRKRAETGPPLFAVEPVTMPVLPSTSTPQINVNTNPIAKSLEMAGFTKEEIMRILGQQGLANGGRAGYAEGSKPTREDSPILQINPMERDIQFSQDPTMEQMPNVGIAAIGLTKKAKDYNRYIKAFESNDPKVFKKWFDSQTKEFSKTKKLAEDAEMFELIPEVARGASKTEKQLANNQLRESMGGYYAQELGPYYSQEIGILDNLIFKAYGGRVSMSDGGLTTTVPPAKGPDSQGVESLFRRRYN
jgi:predicted house-cleaning noncanonical NTP pyrophosphatase (MazG superfamily)